MSEFETLSIYYTHQANTINIIIGILTLASVIGFYLDYRHRKDKERAQKSIELAEQFAKKTIIKLAFINSKFEQFKLDKIVNKINFTKFFDFDSEELQELYHEEDIEKFKSILAQFDDNNKLVFLISTTLNELEYMCMYITTKVADEKYIYDSLHQQFLKTVSYLYINISLINTDNKDKYYTNIISVFNMWKNNYIRATKKEKKLKNKLKPKAHKIK